MNRFILLLILPLALLARAAVERNVDRRPAGWGSVTYLNIERGEVAHYEDHELRLMAVVGDTCTVRVDETVVPLTMARRRLPVAVNGLWVFLASTRPVADSTTDQAFPQMHAFLTGEVVLGVARAGDPLLDPARYVFPVDRSDGFNWTMEEDSHMFAYLTPDRAHEGVDIDLTGARHSERHRLVAVENGRVRWIEPGRPPEVCLLIESERQPGLYYLYQHIDRARVLVAAGERVVRGQPLGHIWGDARWEHLHFTVIASGTPPSYATRYQYVLNVFPQLYELWRGSLSAPAGPTRSEGEFIFADPYWLHGNRQHLGAYEELLGYGWRLDPADPTAKVPNSREARASPTGRSALLGHVQHANNPFTPQTPRRAYTFDTRVVPGRYHVSVRAGHCHVATAQRIRAEDTLMGEWSLGIDEWAESSPHLVNVRDDHLTITIELTDPSLPASLKAVRFVPADR